MPQPNQLLMPKCFQANTYILLASSLVLCTCLVNSVIPPAKAYNKTVTNVTINEAQKQEIGLQLAPVKHGFIHLTVESPGQVQPNAEQGALVSTPSAGRAVKVLSRLGDIVKTGQIMAIIKSDAIGLVQSDLLQSVLQARADIKQQEVGLKLDHITFDRESILYKEQVSAHADLQTAQNQLEKDEANLAALKAKMEATITVAQERLTLLGAPPDSARRVITNKKIDPWVIVRAPRDGLVIERTINPGEMNDGNKQLFTLADLSEVWLIANIFEKDMQLVKKGQEAIVTLDSLPDHIFPAKIVWVGDTVSPTTRTLPVRANVANPQLILKPNMFARIKISVGDAPELLVPHSAVIQQGDKTLVFVKTGNQTFQEREVVTGIEDANNIQIKAGLLPGELVVCRGGIALLGAAMKSSTGK